MGLVYILDTLGGENFDEIARSLTVKEIAYILRFYIFGEKSKIQNGRHFLKFFWKVGLVYFLDPGGRKFWRNRSISHS